MTDCTAACLLADHLVTPCFVPVQASNYCPRPKGKSMQVAFFLLALIFVSIDQPIFAEDISGALEKWRFH